MYVCVCVPFVMVALVRSPCTTRRHHTVCGSTFGVGRSVARTLLNIHKYYIPLRAMGQRPAQPSPVLLGFGLGKLLPVSLPPAHRPFGIKYITAVKTVPDRTRRKLNPFCLNLSTPICHPSAQGTHSSDAIPLPMRCGVQKTPRKGVGPLWQTGQAI